jgi:cell division protein FtsL
MSAQPLPARSTAPRRTTGAAPERRNRVRLTVIPSPVPARSRAPFVTLLATILLAALAAVLMLNIRMTETAYALHDVQMDLALVEESINDLQIQVDSQSAPALLDHRAQELGMTRPETSYYISLADRSVTSTEISGETN